MRASSACLLIPVAVLAIGASGCTLMTGDGGPDHIAAAPHPRSATTVAHAPTASPVDPTTATCADLLDAVTLQRQFVRLLASQTGAPRHLVRDLLNVACTFVSNGAPVEGVAAGISSISSGLSGAYANPSAQAFLQMAGVSYMDQRKGLRDPVVAQKILAQADRMYGTGPISSQAWTNRDMALRSLFGDDGARVLEALGSGTVDGGAPYRYEPWDDVTVLVEQSSGPPEDDSGPVQPIDGTTAVDHSH